MQGEGQLAPLLRSSLPGPRGAAMVELLAGVENPALTARRARRKERSGAPHDPIVWTRALGCNVWDADGNRFVDLSAGFGAASIGHGHPDLRSALRAQSDVLLHALGDLHPSDRKIALCERLAALAPYPAAKVMLGLSGSDAVSAALKTAAIATGRPGVLAFEGGYHGLSYGPLAACGYSEAFRAPFARQLNPHVRFAAFPDADAPPHEAERALAECIARIDDSIGAVLLEPIQGRGGVRRLSPGALPAIASACRERGALLIADEVMTGSGRCGAMLASTLRPDREHGDAGVEPDLICLGKGLGGGIPVSACIGREEVMRAWGDPAGEALHTGTFFGNPLSCAAALATLQVIERERLCERAATGGARVLERLQHKIAGRGRGVRAVRAVGLLIGVELDDGARCLRLVRALLERGYITVPAGSDARVLSLTPPLNIERHLLDGFVDTLDRLLDEAPREAAQGDD